MVAAYYKVLVKRCPTCKVLPASLLDNKNIVPWTESLRRAIRKLRLPEPRLWGLHNYSDVNFLRDGSTRRITRAIKGRSGSPSPAASSTRRARRPRASPRRQVRGARRHVHARPDADAQPADRARLLLQLEGLRRAGQLGLGPRRRRRHAAARRTTCWPTIWRPRGSSPSARRRRSRQRPAYRPVRRACPRSRASTAPRVRSRRRSPRRCSVSSTRAFRASADVKAAGRRDLPPARAAAPVMSAFRGRTGRHGDLGRQDTRARSRRARRQARARLRRRRGRRRHDPSACSSGRVPYYPAYYFPLDDVRTDLLQPDGRRRPLAEPRRRGARYSIGAGGKRDRGRGAALRDSPIPELRDLIRLDWDAMDAWFEEDEEVFTHPRDPYTRVDILPSSRHVRVEVDGVTIAESTRAADPVRDRPAAALLPAQDRTSAWTCSMPTEHRDPLPVQGAGRVLVGPRRRRAPRGPRVVVPDAAAREPEGRGPGRLLQREASTSTSTACSRSGPSTKFS